MLFLLLLLALQLRFLNIELALDILLFPRFALDQLDDALLVLSNDFVFLIDLLLQRARDFQHIVIVLANVLANALNVSLKSV